jgi:L-fuculose-phosphate aldolase
MSFADLTEQRLVSVRDLETLPGKGIREVRVREGAVFTPSARDLLRDLGLTVVTAKAPASVPGPAGTAGPRAAYGTAVSSPVVTSPAAEAAFRSPEAMAIKKEIMAAGQKLWKRGYVDGNGGNISCRLNEQWIICTPTLLSKADLTVDDFCLVDMSGKQHAGARARSSEILLHLEIMKAVPQATAVLHCHPPYATAYAITGLVPPACIIPEQEVFVGTVALSPYETPGTQAFAETVLPYVREHNTILLSNHGIVCWADTVTHAEWYAEVVDTYCHTLVIASHLGAPLTKIPSDKTAHLLDLKKKLGMPDARYGLEECHLCDQPEFPGGVTACPGRPKGARPQTASDSEVERVVQAVTDQVMAALKARG